MISELNPNSNYISGAFGKYTYNRTMPAEVKFGRNAISNFNSYLTMHKKDYSSFSSCKQENPFFYVRYMSPNNKTEKEFDLNLLASGYEQLGKKIYVSLDEANAELAKINANYSAKALDLNSDNYIDIAEASIAILATDSLSTEDNPTPESISGKFNFRGASKMLNGLREIYSSRVKEILLDFDSNFHLCDKYHEFFEFYHNNII